MSTLPSRRRLVAVALALLVGAPMAAVLPFAFVHHGHFQRMVQTGDTAGRVDLDALPQAAGAWGLGAIAGLLGEIVQLDGALWVSPGTDPQGRVRPPQPGERAVLFAGGRVQAWQGVAVPEDMDAAAFEAFVQAQAGRWGLAPDQPFVFRVEGRFPHLLWHVVTGAPPAGGGHRAQGPGGHGQGGHGGHGARDGGAGPHAAPGADMRLFRQPGARGQLVGVYSGPALEGAVTHPGERFHVHYVDGAATVSGHVDRYSVAAGSTLLLPLR